MPDNTPFTPTLADISEACTAFRAGWSPQEHEARLNDGINQQVWLLAEILRPMAVAAGYTRETTGADSALCAPAV